MFSNASTLTQHSTDPSTINIQPGMKLRDVEKIVILETLKQQANNRTRAARVLGIGIRTLQRKLKQYRSTEPEVALITAVNPSAGRYQV